MIQTIALENVSDPEMNPDFNPHVPFFTSPRGLKAQEFAKQKLARYTDSEDFRKVITFRLMTTFYDQLCNECALIVTHPKLGKTPVTALLLNVTQESPHTIKVKARVR